MRVILIQSGLKKALEGKSKKPDTMSNADWEELDEKALTAIQLMLSKEVLREVAYEKTTTGLWNRLESLYMTKSLANKLRLKERLYTIRMAEDTPIQTHLNEFNSICMDLENLDIKIDDEDKTVILIVSLPPSYRQFREIMLYGNSDTLSFDDVKSHLLSKEKFDLDSNSDDKAEGLTIRGRNSQRGSGDHKSRSKSRGRKNNKFRGYCKKSRHTKDECWKKPRKKKKKKAKHPQKQM